MSAVLLARSFARSAAIALLCGVAMNAHAAESEAATAAAADTAAATDADADSESSRADIVVRAASQTEEARKRLSAVAGAIQVVDSAQTERASVANLADVLAFQPGVYAKNEAGTDAIKISIRGSGIVGGSQGYRRGLYFMFDGLPLTGPGATPVDLIEPFGLARTEVQIGANAFNVGSAQLGGSVNLVSQTGATASPLTIRLEGGKFGYLKGQIATGGTTSFGDYYLSVTGGKIDGYQPNSEQKSLGIQGNISFNVSDNIKTTFYVRARYRRNEMPGLLTLDQLRNNPRSGLSSYVDNNSRSVAKHFWVGNKTVIQTSENSSLTAGLVFYYHPWLGYYGTSRLNQPVYNDISGILRYERTDTLFGRDSKTTIGFTSLNSTNVAETSYRRIGSKDVFFRNSFDGNNQNLYFDNDTEVLNRLHLQLSGSLLRSYGLGGVRIPDKYQHNDTFWNFAPRAGFRFDVDDQTQLFGNISRSIEAAPSFAYPGATASLYTSGPATGYPKTLSGLVPQKATTYEVGGRGQSRLGDWSVSIYRADVVNELLQTQYETAGGDLLTAAANASPTRHQGIEAGLTTKLWKSDDGDVISLRQAYTYSDYHYKKDTALGDNTLPGIPKHYYQAELTYTANSGFFASVNTEVSSKNYLDYANTQAAPSYAIFGARIGAPIPAFRADVFLDLRNLGNKHYASAVTPVYSLAGSTTGTIAPSEGFRFVTGISLKY